MTRLHSVSTPDGGRIQVVDPPREGRDLPERGWNAKQGEHHYFGRARKPGRALGNVRFNVEWVGAGWYWIDQRRTADEAAIHGPFATSANAWWNAKLHFGVTYKQRRDV